MADTPRMSSTATPVRPPQAKIRVLIVDDHDVVVDGIRFNLETQDDIKVVGTCSRGRDVLEAVAQLEPTVVILDIKLPDMDGIRVAEDLHQNFPAARVLLMSAYAADPQYVVRALKARVGGYIDKNQPREDLIQTVRSVAAGLRVWNAAVDEIVLGRVRTPELKPIDDTPIERLTEREIEVLREVAQGLSNKEIAAHLGIAVSVVKTHLHHILQKLNVQDRDSAVNLARYLDLI